MQNLIGYSQCVNRSSPSPSSPENVEYPQILAVSFLTLACVQTNGILMQSLKWKMYIITNIAKKNLTAK